MPRIIEYYKHISVFLLSLAMLWPGTSSAGPDYSAVSQITVVNTREYAVDLYLPQASNPMGCSLPGWFRLKSSSPNYEVIYSFILTQYARQDIIRLYANGCDSDGASLIVAARRT